MYALEIVATDILGDVERMVIPYPEWESLEFDKMDIPFGGNGWTADDFANPEIYQSVTVRGIYID